MSIFSYYFSMIKLLYNATSSFMRNFIEISHLQEQRADEIKDMNGCIQKLINGEGGPNKLRGGQKKSKN